MSSFAECVGLWLAEGDSKTKSEITFTNNSWSLVELFYEKVIAKLKGNPRIYVYTPDGSKPYISLGNCIVKYYIDTRASKPYYILRLASVKETKKWKEKVNIISNNPRFYTDVLRGFFAGEGNIKIGSHSNRTLRIAQKSEMHQISKALNFINISYKFRKEDRSYYITGKWNWDILSQFKLASLHPEKRDYFNRVYESFKQEHYPNHFIKNFIISNLKNPITSKGLSKKLNRSEARICEVLISLRKSGKVKKFRVRSSYYWVNSSANTIVISKVKEDYLSSLDGKTTQEIAKTFKVSWKSSFNRLKELENLSLVSRDTNGIWHLKKTNKKIIVK